MARRFRFVRRRSAVRACSARIRLNASAQHLPSAVGLVALGGHAAERKAALELAVNLLMGAAPAHEVNVRPVIALFVTIAEYS